MIDIIIDLFTVFVLGLLTPLTAVCVLPLYPGFISYLTHQVNNNSSKYMPLKLGLLVSFGVISFMTVLGLLFTTFLQKSLTSIVTIVSPIAFLILLIISIFLIFDFNFNRIIPHINISNKSKSPFVNAFFYGLFFGAIILPCNPGFIAAFFTKAIFINSPIISLLSFLFFGIGIATPLLILALIGSSSKKITSKLVKYKKSINIVTGLIMFIISSYYLFKVFEVHKLIIF
jgi:cytochrome c-type biogenesis protein